MKHCIKILLLGSFLCLLSTPLLAGKPDIETMQIKLSNLEVDISKEKLVLLQREESLNEMKVKALSNQKIDKKAMAVKLAEIESALAKDKLLLSQREVKLHEMKVALLKATH